jgi:hypothetical protein
VVHIRLTDGTPSSASILLRGASSLTVVCDRASCRSVGSDSPKNTEVKASSPCVSHSSATRRRIVSSCGSSSRWRSPIVGIRRSSSASTSVPIAAWRR